MGRIKSTLVKRTAKKLLQEENSFNSSFKDNKKVLGPNMPSKRIRNMIAGYVTHLRRMAEKEPKLVS